MTNYHRIEPGDTVYLEDWSTRTVKADGGQLYVMVDEPTVVVAYEKRVVEVEVCECCGRELG